MKADHFYALHKYMQRSNMQTNAFEKYEQVDSIVLDLFIKRKFNLQVIKDKTLVDWI